MARLPDAEAVLRIAKKWRDDCLLGNGSIFTSKSLWTLENARALEKHYSHNLDYGEGDFFQKLEGQLTNAPHTAIQLAAEIFWASISSSQAGRHQAEQSVTRSWTYSVGPEPRSPMTIGPWATCLTKVSLIPARFTQASLGGGC